MPNYVQNILRLEGEKERIKELLEAVKGDKSAFDFNRIIPMPEDLAIECSSKQRLSYEVYVAIETGAAGEFLQLRYDNHCRKNTKIPMEKFIDLLLKNGTADLALGKKAYNNLKQYGHKDWYSWCIQHHGTKWNALEVKIYECDNEIRFQTAWSAPLPVIEKLFQTFPDITIHFLWADEDIGTNCGEMHYYANEGKSENLIENFTSAAYAVYVDCWGESDCLVRDERGRYTRKTYSGCYECIQCSKCTEQT